MRIEKIELNKIKITLLCEDLQMYNINVKKINPDSPELHTFLCEMMKIVRSETNFNPYEGQVVVEATPSGDGLVLMLSKLGEIQAKPRIRRIRAYKKAPEQKEYICIFLNFGMLGEYFKICTHLSGASLYEMNEKFYLIFSSDSPDSRLREFGRLKQSSEISKSYLAEHGKHIAKGKNLDNIINFFKGE